MTTAVQRPTRAIFRDRKDGGAELAIRPEAIGILFDTYDDDDEVDLVGGVAVVCIEGPLEHRAGWWWDSYESIAARFAAAIGDARAHAVLLKFDSPGGEVSGLFETVRAMRAMAADSRKLVVAYVDEAAYSAAYALACVASEIYMPESAGVGSVGVITSLLDLTKMNDRMGVRVEVIASGAQKADGNPDVALSKETIGRVQARVDGLAGLFFDVVSASRGMSAEAVKALEAGAFYGDNAVRAGLADGVLSLDDVLDTLASLKPTKDNQGAEAMSRVIAAKKAVDDARKALANAKDATSRRAASAALAKAEKAYKAAQAAEPARASTTTTVETETSDDAEDEESELADIASDDDDEDSSSSSSSSSSSTGTDDEMAADGDNAKTGLHTKDRLLRLCRQITGKRSIAEVMGALDGMAVTMKKGIDLQARLDRLEAKERAARVDALIADGKRAGKIAPAQVAYFRDMGMRSTKQLRGYLATAPSMVSRTRDVEEADDLEAIEQASASHQDSALAAEQRRNLGLDAKAAPKAVNTSGRYVPVPRTTSH